MGIYAWGVYVRQGRPATDVEPRICFVFSKAEGQKLTELYPDVEMEMQWADEDMGYNAGIITYYSKELTVTYFDTDSHEALTTYIELWGVGDSEFLERDENGIWKRKKFKEINN